MLALLAILAIAAPTGSGASQQQATRTGLHPDRMAFRSWLQSAEHKRGATRGLLPYFRTQKRDFVSSRDYVLSPMASAKAALFWLGEGELAPALRIAEGLVSWQELEGKNASRRTAGAFASQIVWTGERWSSGSRYYSGDNLVILEALTAVYRRTGEERFLRAAESVGTWLVDVMCRGQRLGMWKEDHGAPMHFVTKDGDFDNRIHTAVELLWIVALKHLGEASGEQKFIDQYEKATGFLLSGQSPWGVWYDHYDPGYPARRYDASRWRWFGEGRELVVGDNALRAALGALRVGARDRAIRAAQWLRTEEGGVPAYLDARSGAGRFDPSTPPYYDVVVSGLWRVLARELGYEAEARRAEAFLGRTQNPTGGWYWGLQRAGLRPVERSEAVLTGFWAVTDLRYR